MAHGKEKGWKTWRHWNVQRQTVHSWQNQITIFHFICCQLISFVKKIKFRVQWFKEGLWVYSFPPVSHLDWTWFSTFFLHLSCPVRQGTLADEKTLHVTVSCKFSAAHGTGKNRFHLLVSLTLLVSAYLLERKGGSDAYNVKPPPQLYITKKRASLLNLSNHHS